MASGNPHTSVRSRTVASELRRLREDRHLSCADVGRVLGVSASKISRIETGNSGMQMEDVAALLGFYQVAATKRDKLLDLLRRGEQKGWWERQAGLPDIWRAVIDFENKAARIQNYEGFIVPGLMQTNEYSRAFMQGDNPTLTEEEMDNLVASRGARQALLTRRNAPQYLAVMHEIALQIPVGEPGVMARQRQHLLTMMERPNISLRVIPTSAGSHAGLLGSFAIMEFTEEPALVYVENQKTALFLEEAADLAGYRQSLQNILNVSLAPDATVQLIAAEKS
jgi:transcriptional regulator with XRE-family HTH domain